jgi:hypothetical protein
MLEFILLGCLLVANAAREPDFVDVMLVYIGLGEATLWI